MCLLDANSLINFVIPFGPLQIWSLLQTFLQFVPVVCPPNPNRKGSGPKCWPINNLTKSRFSSGEINCRTLSLVHISLTKVSKTLSQRAALTK